MRDGWLKKFLLRAYWVLDDCYTNYAVKHGKVQKRKIVFDSYGGKGYGDNPKYIAEEIHRQGLNWDMVWLVNDLSMELPPYVRKALNYSNEAKRELATARAFITNFRSGMRPLIKRKQIFLQTWHAGLSLKRTEGEVEKLLSQSYVAHAKRDGSECDAIISSCALQSKVFKEHYWLQEKTEILEFGLPRCDALFATDQRLMMEKVKKKLNVPNSSKIVLYVPTFRNNKSIDGYALEYEQVVDAFERVLGQPCVMIVRLHPNVEELSAFLAYNDRIINGSGYPDVQELYIAADAVITDYSTVAFDAALLDKPVFLCALDYDAYQQERGLPEVYDLCPFPRSRTNAELIQDIADFSHEEYMRNLRAFKRDVWKPFDDGHAAQRTVEWLKNHI